WRRQRVKVVFEPAHLRHRSCVGKAFLVALQRFYQRLRGREIAVDSVHSSWSLPCSMPADRGPVTHPLAAPQAEPAESLGVPESRGLNFRARAGAHGAARGMRSRDNALPWLSPRWSGASTSSHWTTASESRHGHRIRPRFWPAARARGYSSAVTREFRSYWAAAGTVAYVALGGLSSSP